MLFLDRTLATLAENLALDEALLLDAESEPRALASGLLRVWQWPEYAVVLGVGGRIADDVQEVRCRADGVPLARRSSGGGTVLLGPGCLLYTLVLPYDRDPALGQLRSSYCYILGRIKDALRGIAPNLDVCGSSDIAWRDRKVSGNAQQRKRTHLMHHGSLLYAFDFEMAARYLKLPPRQPEYRQQREHRDFLANLPADAPTLTRCLRDAWRAQEELREVPLDRVRVLVADRYTQQEWIRRR
jgi:lipoate-protein ligase A